MCRLNSKFKKVLALFVAGCLCVSTGYLAVSAANADGYNGRAKEHVYLQNGVDEFLNTENFFGSYAYNQVVDEDEIYMPGDSISGSATVSNENAKTVNIYLYADTTALEVDFGFKPSTSLREGLRNFAEWYQAFYNN